MHNVEWVATCASLQGKYAYPKSELDSLWEPLLQCQFHDVLPGSSIRLVYDDAEKIYADIDRRAKKLLADASHHLPQTDGFVSINTLGIPRRELVEVSINEKSSHEAEALRRAAVQVSRHGDSTFLLMEDLGADGRLMSCPSPATVMRGIEAVSINEDGNGSFTMRSSNISIKVRASQIASVRSTADPLDSCRLLTAESRPSTTSARGESLSLPGVLQASASPRTIVLSLTHGNWSRIHWTRWRRFVSSSHVP